jgi:putative aldouronate transport system permease protein
MRAKARTAEDWVIDALVWTVMVVFCLSIVYPFWGMLVDSFSTPEYARSEGIKLWPRPIHLQAYRDVFGNDVVFVGYANTLIRSIGGTALTLVVGFSAAYALSKKRLPFNRSLTVLMVFTMFFGGGLIPTFLWFKQLGILETRFVLMLPHIASAYYIIIMRRFFEALPIELEESAFIDGASPYTVLLRIVVPLSTPVIATVGLWSVVFHWNEWFGAMIYTTKREFLVLGLLLRRILIEHMSTNLLDMATEDEARMDVTEDSVRAATMFVSIGPVLLAYPFIQRYFVKGIMVGSVKG